MAKYVVFLFIFKKISFKRGGIMKGGIGILLWKISVALYLIANGVLGITNYSGGDFKIIFDRMQFPSIFVTIASVIALVAGILVLLEMLNVKVSFLDTLILIIAIIWAIYVVIELIGWVKAGFDDFWHILQRLAVHLMVLASLLIASRKV
jgi:hypothetical protein